MFEVTLHCSLQLICRNIWAILYIKRQWNQETTEVGVRFPAYSSMMQWGDYFRHLSTILHSDVQYHHHWFLEGLQESGTTMSTLKCIKSPAECSQVTLQNPFSFDVWDIRPLAYHAPELKLLPGPWMRRYCLAEFEPGHRGEVFLSIYADAMMRHRKSSSVHSKEEKKSKNNKNNTNLMLCFENIQVL